MTTFTHRSKKVQVSKVAAGLWCNLLKCGSQVAPVEEVEKDLGIQELISKGLVSVAGIGYGYPHRTIELADQSLLLGCEHKTVLRHIEQSVEPVAVSSLIKSVKKASVSDPLPVIKRLIDLSLIEFDKSSLSLKTCY